jgi:hypothetical protein
MKKKKITKTIDKLVLDYDPNLFTGAECVLYKRPFSKIKDKISREECKSQNNEFCLEINQFGDKLELAFSKKDAAQIVKYLQSNL